MTDILHRYSNPRMSATIENWPSGTHRVTAQFSIEIDPKRGEVNDPNQHIEHKLALGPWFIPDGVGTLVCAGDDPDKPGEMLFSLRSPIGPSWASDNAYPSAILAEYAAFIVGAVNHYRR